MKFLLISYYQHHHCWNTVSEITEEQKSTAIASGLRGRLWEDLWGGAVGSEDRMETAALGPYPEVTISIQQTPVFIWPDLHCMQTHKNFDCLQGRKFLLFLFSRWGRERKYYLQVLISSDSNAGLEAWLAITQKTWQNGMFEWLITRPSFFFCCLTLFVCFKNYSLPSSWSNLSLPKCIVCFLRPGFLNFPIQAISNFPTEVTLLFSGSFSPTLHAFCSSRDILSTTGKFRGKNKAALFMNVCSTFLNRPCY